MREIVYWRREMNEDMEKGIYICHRVVERNLFSEFYKTNLYVRLNPFVVLLLFSLNNKN